MHNSGIGSGKTPEFPRRHQPLALAEMRLGGRRAMAGLNTGLYVGDRVADARVAVSRQLPRGAWLSPDNSRYLAEQIPGAQLLALL